MASFVKDHSVLHHYMGYYLRAYLLQGCRSCERRGTRARFDNYCAQV